MLLLFLEKWTPAFLKENAQLALFFGLLTYALLVVNWIVTTDWEGKFHWCSLTICASGLLHLHYSNAILLLQYENVFVTIWFLLLSYHASTWKNNYRRIQEELEKPNPAASLRRFEGSVFRFCITMPATKNASNQWNAPPFKNLIHVLLCAGYTFLLILHIVPFLTPIHCLSDPSPLCCRYNYVMQGFESHEVNRNYCSGRVRIAFAGSWSTGKTFLINAVLGHSYSTAQSAPAPTTDKFVCLALGADYSDPIRSDDFDNRKHCEIMSHINDVTHKVCGATLPNVLDVADTDQEFGTDFVFFDMPGWQREYASNCVYRTFYSQLIDKVDFTYVVCKYYATRLVTAVAVGFFFLHIVGLTSLPLLFSLHQIIIGDVNHGKIEGEFADFFRNKARGSSYELIYNRYVSDAVDDMAFLNQQYAKMSTGQELLSLMYTMKLHENSTQFANEFRDDVLLLRAKIKSVNQTVHDNRKKLMKENIMMHRAKLTGTLSLRKLKIGDRLVEEDLNVHVQPKRSKLRILGIEL
jgi:hypothetical protein